MISTFQLIDDHFDGHATSNEAHSTDAMDVDGTSVSGYSERVSNGVEDMQTESSHASVSLPLKSIILALEHV